GARACVIAKPKLETRQLDARIGVAHLCRRAEALRRLLEPALGGEEPTLRAEGVGVRGPDAKGVGDEPRRLVVLAEPDERLRQAGSRPRVLGVRLLESEAQLLLRVLQPVHVPPQL